MAFFPDSHNSKPKSIYFTVTLNIEGKSFFNIPIHFLLIVWRIHQLHIMCFCFLMFRLHHTASDFQTTHVCRWHRLHGHHAVNSTSMYGKNMSHIASGCTTNKTHMLKWELTSSGAWVITSSTLTIQSILQSLTAIQHSVHLWFVFYYLFLQFRHSCVIP